MQIFQIGKSLVGYSTHSKKRPQFPANPVDYFIQKKLESNELQLSQQTGPYEFIRRATFDLIGLPPSEVKSKTLRILGRKIPNG